MNNLPIELQQIIYEYSQEKDKKDKIINDFMDILKIVKKKLDKKSKITTRDIIFYLVWNDSMKNKSIIIPKLKIKIETNLLKYERYPYYRNKLAENNEKCMCRAFYCIFITIFWVYIHNIYQMMTIHIKKNEY